MFEQNNTDSAKQDVASIKNDIINLTTHLISLKGKGGEVILEQLSNLGSVINELKDKSAEKAKDAVNVISSSTAQHPLRNLMYAFGAGIVMSMIIRR